MDTVSPPDTWTYALRLPHDPRAARVARMTVRAALTGHGKGEHLHAVELLASELVTNAYLHTDGPASLRLTALADGRLRVGVWDSHPHIPALLRGPAPVDAEGGRGLRLVQEYADCWGGWAMGEGTGKLLWFEVGGGGGAG
ncbi:ATP-binding protein [Streptomyces sp. B93]|uniref:ATP-binding protein n=1 Tax=Streptomyces sp. B93 TaxID=2824875 RepID=UPI001B39BFD8|nr:ATP-binding protein [Streptomyces sp. B93]MBQ1089473.1 ATP-binding protein [Streptomyces sp. B93]